MGQLDNKKNDLGFLKNLTVESKLQKSDEQSLIEAAKNNQHYEINRLVSEGVDINFRDKDGNTALHYASKILSYNCIWKLISMGADISLQNEKGKIASSLIDFKADKEEANKCKDLFSMCSYANYIISGAMPHFSREDKHIFEDTKFIPLIMHKMWDRIVEEGIRSRDFLDDVNVRIDCFADKVHINGFKSKLGLSKKHSFTDELKNHLKNEWNGRVEKLIVASKILKEYKIESIALLDNEGVNKLTEQYFTDSKLKSALDLLEECPISIKERQVLKKIQNFNSEESENKKEDIVNHEINPDQENGYNKIISELATHFVPIKADHKSDIAKKNLEQLLKLINNPQLGNELQAKFVDVIINNSNFMLTQHNNISQDEAQSVSLDIIGAAG